MATSPWKRRSIAARVSMTEDPSSKDPVNANWMHPAHSAEGVSDSVPRSNNGSNCYLLGNGLEQFRSCMTPLVVEENYNFDRMWQRPFRRLGA